MTQVNGKPRIALFLCRRITFQIKVMKIQHFRNATMTLETDNEVILVDPMIGPAGTIPTFTFFRFKPKKNPIVPLPDVCRATLERVTHCLITHQHPDHLDKEAEKFLLDRKIPVTCSVKDEADLRKKGLNVVQTVSYWERAPFLGVGGTIEGIPARHGYGFIAKPMGNVMGFHIELPDQPSIYLSSDTVYTEAVDKVLREYQPEISVVASGSAQLDIFQPLLMRLEDIVKFVKNSPGKVIANHLEAVNHCPTTRAGLKARLKKEGLLEKAYVPVDGETMNL